MATKFNYSTQISNYQKLLVEKHLIESRFPNFKCNEVRFNTIKLIGKGSIQPTEHSISYKLKLEYSVWDIPKMYIVEPEIIPTANIHIYKAGNLCLYYPEETPWKHSYHISDTILPWTAEWLVFYELFKIKRKWLGKSALHSYLADKSDKT